MSMKQLPIPLLCRPNGDYYSPFDLSEPSYSVYDLPHAIVQLLLEIAIRLHYGEFWFSVK